jgi:hypothetical protein
MGITFKKLSLLGVKSEECWLEVCAYACCMQFWGDVPCIVGACQFRISHLERSLLKGKTLFINSPMILNI